MRSPAAALLRAALGAALLAALGGCVSGGSGSEYTNGTLVTGFVVEEDGNPVANARIWIRPTGWLQDTAEAGKPLSDEVARTDARGYFYIEAVPFGAYTVEAQDSRGRGLAAPLLSLGGESPLGRQVVKPLGRLEGTLRDSSGRPAAGFVQVFSLTRVAKADSAGSFRVEGLPQGIHRIRVVSPTPGVGFRQPAQVAILAGRTTRLDSLPAVGFGQEDYTRWPHSRRLHVDPAAVGVRETVRDFPLLVRFHRGDIDFDSSDGKDLRFAGPDGKPLAYELERWEPGSGLAEAWVRLDSVPADTGGFDLTVHWGKRDAPDLSDGKRAFAGFSGVWHLSEAQWADGPSTFRDASPTGSPAAGTLQDGNRRAVWGYSGLFQGSHALRASGSAALRPDSALTVSAWALASGLDADGGEILSLGDNYGLRIKPGGAPRFFVFDDPDWDGTSPPPVRRWKNVDGAGQNLVDKQWHHVAGVFDGADLRIYVDGVPRGSVPHAGSLAYPLGKDLSMGRNGDGDSLHDFFGQIDEVQISGSPRAAAWIRLAFENQKPGSTLPRFR